MASRRAYPVVVMSLVATPRVEDKQSIASDHCRSDLITGLPHWARAGYPFPEVNLPEKDRMSVKKNKDVFRLFFRLSAHFRPHSCAIFHPNTPHNVLLPVISIMINDDLSKKITTFSGKVFSSELP